MTGVVDVIGGCAVAAMDPAEVGSPSSTIALAEGGLLAVKRANAESCEEKIGMNFHEENEIGRWFKSASGGLRRAEVLLGGGDGAATSGRAADGDGSRDSDSATAGTTAEAGGARDAHGEAAAGSSAGAIGGVKGRQADT